MNFASLRKILAVGLATVAGYSWATPSLPQNDSTLWQDISLIEWSTDHGSTWGQSSPLLVGQTVEFKITMHKTNIGNHYADFVKAWLDLNGDEHFTANEAVLFGYHVDNDTRQNSWNPERVSGQSFSFISNAITLTDTLPADLWLLVRMTCSESLILSAGLNSNDPWTLQWHTPIETFNNYFSPTRHYFQGESELVHLTVINQVPEPGTLSLLTAAMLAAALGRSRKPRA